MQVWSEMSERVGRDRGRERLQDMMSSATSTNAQVTKRTRFNETTIEDTFPSKRQSPKALALDFIQAKTGSLQPTITSTLLKLGTHHLELHMKAFHKATQKKRMMDDEEFIPRSARIEFTLMVAKEAEDDQEFIDIREATNEIITDCRKSLKAQILKCIDVEYKLLHQQIVEDFAKNLRFVTKQHLVLLEDNSNIDETVTAFLFAYKGELMQYLNCNEETLYTTYKRVHSLIDFPKLNARVRDAINVQSNTDSSQSGLQPTTQEEWTEVTAPTINHDAESTTLSQTHDFTAFAFGSNTPTPTVLPPSNPTPPPLLPAATTDLNDHPRPTNSYVNNRTTPSNYTQYAKQAFHLFYSKIAEPLRLAFLNTFVYSLGHFKKHAASNEVKLQLKKLTEEHFVTSATEDANMLIDEEQSVDRTTLNELIKKATMEETKQLKLQIHRLNDKIATINNNTSKNITTRGSGSASGKKKSPKTRKSSSPSPQQKQKGTRKVDGHENASSKNNKNMKQKKNYSSKSSSNKKKPPSSAKKNKHQNGSRGK